MGTAMRLGAPYAAIISLLAAAALLTCGEGRTRRRDFALWPE
jgi:hypothetical protein